MMSKDYIVVTGGAGFIGSHLCEKLLSLGEKVIIIDNFNDFYDPEIKHSNIKDVVDTVTLLKVNQNNLEIIEGDIRDLIFLDNVFREHQVNMVIHLAAMAGVRPSIENPILYNNVNINGTANMLEMCKKYKIKKFIFASSSSVYGNNNKVPFSESDCVDFPISPYASTKKAGELLCYTYHHLYDIDTACLRFFTVYGPRQRPDLAIHKFTKFIYEEKEIPVFGDGYTERDYTYIDDIIDGIIKAIDWVNNNKYEVFNLGESNTVSLNYMIETLEGAIGRQANKVYLPMQLGDVQRTFADITKSKNILKYSPKTSFEIGIQHFIKWYKSKNCID